MKSNPNFFKTALSYTACALISAVLVLFVIAVILLFLLRFKPGFRESLTGRYEPYPKEEVIRILNEEYKRDFTIISAGESDPGRVLYKVKCNDFPEIVFTFEDQSDGFAGYFAFDDFPEKALSYAAEKSGFDVYYNKNVFIIYNQSDGLDKTAEKLKRTADIYFGVFSYCKGKLSSHPSYSTLYQNRRTDFALTYIKSADQLDTMGSFAELCIGEKESFRKTILPDMSAADIKEIIRHYTAF